MRALAPHGAKCLHPAALVLARHHQASDVEAFARASFEWLTLPDDVARRSRIRDLWVHLLVALGRSPSISLTRLPCVLSNDEQLAQLLLSAEPGTRAVLVGRLRHESTLLTLLRPRLGRCELDILLAVGPSSAGTLARRVLERALLRRLFRGTP